MSNSPLVSAILPIYNPEKAWLEKAISSVLQQSYENIELIIVNDGSEKDLEYYIDEETLSRENIRAFSQENQGFTGATNTAMKKAKGKFIAPIGQDDIWKKRKTERQIEIIENSKYSICFSRAEVINSKGDIVRKSPRKPDHFFEELFKQNFIRYESTLISKDILEKYDYLDERYRICSDYDFWFKTLKNEDFLFIEETLVKKRMHEESGSSDKLSYLNELETIYREYSDDHNRSFDKIWSRKLRWIGKEAYQSGRKRKARKIWMRSLQHSLNMKSFLLFLLSFFPKKIFSKISKINASL